MFRHPARKNLGYGAFDAAMTFHILPNGDVWAFTNMDKSMGTVVYSAVLGRQVTSDDGYPVFTGGRIAQAQSDTVSSEKTVEAAAAKAKALIAPPAPKVEAPVEAPVAAPAAFVPADVMTVSKAAPVADGGGLKPYLVGAAAAVGLLFLGSKLLPRGA